MKNQMTIFFHDGFRKRTAASAYSRACLESLCGNTDRALEYLELALQSSPSYAEWALHDPDLDLVRKDSRFATLIPVMSGR